MTTKHKHSKLVRDKIPEIIKAQGGAALTKELDGAEYFDALNQKLTEEVAEYLENYDIEELADIVEVIYALVSHSGMSLDDFERIRMKKHAERGGFEKKILLIN